MVFTHATTHILYGKQFFCHLSLYMCVIIYVIIRLIMYSYFSVSVSLRTKFEYKSVLLYRPTNK